jgi:putative ABC transport system substrate-binding protein
VASLQQVTRTVPVVFVNVTDPVGAGFVESLAQPGGNTTGFTLFEYGISAKWMELLKEAAPSVRRAAVLRDSAIAAGGGQLGALQVAAPLFGLELLTVGVRDAGEIERAVAAFARGVNGGLIVTASVLTGVHRDLITGVRKAPRHEIASAGSAVAGPPALWGFGHGADGYPVRIGAQLKRYGTNVAKWGFHVLSHL